MGVNPLALPATENGASMKSYTLLNGKTLDLSGLSPTERKFLRDL